jgi:hypothetical protein
LAYSVTDLLTDISSVTHGTTINKIPNIYGIINRAARALLLDVNPKETQKIVQLSQVFNDVYDYPCPVDLKGDMAVDIRPQAGREPWDVFTQEYAETFDANKLLNISNVFYTQWNTGLKTLRIEAPTLTSPVTITDTGNTTGWSVGGGATNLSIDQTNNVAGGGAITFDLSAGQASGYIENSTLTPIDLSGQENISQLFAWCNFPTGSDFTSVNLRWGSSASDYYSYTATATQMATMFVNGENLLTFPWLNAPTTGTPDSSSISYVRVTYNYDSTLQTGVKFCNLTSNLGYIFELQYYSKYLFRNATTNVFQESVVDSADNGLIINLDTESYNLLFNKVAFYVCQSLQGADAQYDADYWQTEYVNGLVRYRAQNPNESLKKTEVYYSIRPKGYTRFSGRFWA